MSDQRPRNLSEISHLFLSGIREMHTPGAPRPMRMPPQAPPRTDLTIDLTPEEFAQVFGDKVNPEPTGVPIRPIRAVIASHLGPSQLSRVQEYAAHICPPGKRIGLIAVDASEFRLSIFEHNPDPHPSAAPIHENETMDPRKMTECLEELAWDVDQWLLLLPSPRGPEARLLLRDVTHWSLLMTCDHDGVVACYRTLKGLADLHRPKLSLATLDASDEQEAANAFGRLSSVCRQFLEWPIEIESSVSPSSDVTEHVVLWCCTQRDKGQLATALQWQVITDFLARGKKTAVSAITEKSPTTDTPSPAAATEPALAPTSVPSAATNEAPFLKHPALPEGSMPEVIDLPNGSSTPTGIVTAVLHGGSDLVECPVKPPMCPEASVAVTRDHRLVLVAVSQHGLNDLHQIGRAYQWLIENRPLICMAVPQMSIDAHQMPKLHLLVDQSDMSADVLQPILQSTSVFVQAYRKLRWGGKSGLLLEAA